MDMRDMLSRVTIATVVLVFAADAGAQVAGARMKVVRPDTGKLDSTTVRVLIHTDEMGRMVKELIASRELEEAVAIAMREGLMGERGDPRRLRELSDSLRVLARKNSGLFSRIELSCKNARVPDGYLGVQFSDEGIRKVPMPAVAVVRSEPMKKEWPTIDSVMPASPAFKAGVRPGDVVLSIAGHDTRGPIDVDDVLKPGARVMIKIMREGSPRDVSVAVEKRPSEFGPQCQTFEEVLAPDVPQMRTMGRGMARPVRVEGPTLPPPPPDVFFTAPAGGFAYAFSAGMSSLAGAQFQVLDDDARQSLGVDNGLLVTRVATGTPARDAGLRGLDVIIAADGQPVRSVVALRRIIGGASSNAVRLQVVRAGKTQELTLRWTGKERP